MSNEKKGGLGKFVVGAAVGAGIGLLFAPKKGSETRKDVKKKMDEMVNQVKNIDMDDLKKEFNEKVEEIKAGLADLDKEKVASIAKEKAVLMKDKTQELVELAKEKGTPVLKKTAEDLKESVSKIYKETVKKTDKKEK